MATYILLATYTEQGIRGIKDTVKRTESVKELAKKAGVTMKESYWALGQYDVIAVFDAPDDETMTAFSLSVARLGNVKTQTLRAFSSGDMTKILGKMVSRTPPARPSAALGAWKNRVRHKAGRGQNRCRASAGTGGLQAARKRRPLRRHADLCGIRARR